MTHDPPDDPGSVLHSLTDDGRYRALVEAVVDYAIYMLDINGVVATWNAGARRLKGYDQAEILGQSFSRFYTEEDREAGLPANNLSTAARDGKFEGEGWRVRKDGTRFWAGVVIDPIYAPTGPLVGFAKITRDLTERKKTEDALRRSEQQFRLLVQGVTDYSIYLLEPDGRVASWNAGAQRIKGYRPDEIIGQHFSRFYTEEDRLNGEPQRALDTAGRDGRFEKEGWRVRKNGERFWANVVIDALYDDGGQLLGFAKITRDITERRETQFALERTRDALFMSQKMEAIGQLTGGIAHDFNNLLTAILGSLDIARKRIIDNVGVTRLIDNAIQGARRGAGLTQRLLAFARHQELNIEAIDIPVLIHGMTELLEQSLGPKVAIETRFPINLPHINADPNQLEAALLNLVVNARDAMPEGGEIVMTAHGETISVADHKLAPGRYVCISVTDTGEGMDEATLARAVEPFFTTKEVGKGTGLGLSMVAGLAEQSGGQLILKSQKQKGTSVEIWLPVAKKPEAAVAAAGEQEEPAGRRSLVVLVVDDDPLVLTNMAAMLDDIGFKVFEASSALQALAALRREATIELVITDQAMPQMTGMELIREIRAEWPALPVILASGFAEQPGKADPTVRRLAKPFLQFDLVRAVDDAMMQRSARAIGLRAH